MLWPIDCFVFYTVSKQGQIVAGRKQQNEQENIRKDLVELLVNFEQHLTGNNLRTQVLELVPANLLLRKLGRSLIADDDARSARDRILLYMKKYVGTVLHGDELMVVAGISEYARRIRELRVEYGWPILSGATVSEMRENAQTEDEDDVDTYPDMRPDQYMLTSVQQDREAAFRWNVANEIRKDNRLSVRDKILTYLRRNVGKIVNGEELRYVAGNKSEWARRTRELRTEYGWPVATKSNGRPDMPVGSYLLEKDRQSPEHDRKIKDSVRRSVMRRDKYTCRLCGWNHDQWNPSDPRHLEAHHIEHHVKGGENDETNLITYCNICHDEVHRDEGKKKG